MVIIKLHTGAIVSSKEKYTIKNGCIYLASGTLLKEHSKKKWISCDGKTIIPLTSIYVIREIKE